MLSTSIASFAALRQREFARLDATGVAYLDYAGAALYPASLVREDAVRLERTVLGNPHSENAPSRASTEAIDAVRALTLRLLRADPAEYDVVLTSNATGAVRILAEAFPFRRESRFVLTADNHNSVNGLGVSARRRGARVERVPLDSTLRVENVDALLTPAKAPSLFAFPAQSNFSGVRHPLWWVRDAQKRGYRVLVDAAAYLPSSTLSLEDVPADFVALSYYKLFGYPTGVGALVARRDGLALLQRRYFGGGTVQFVSVQNQLVRLKAGAEGFEDGTPNFLGMRAVADGLRWLESLDIESVSSHVAGLTETFLDRLRTLGDRIRVYGPRDAQARGGIITFNVVRDRAVVPYEVVEATARELGVAIRGGCFCNPGAAERAFDIPAEAARACLQDEFNVARFRRCLGGAAIGAVRASVGVATNDGDLDRVFDCIERVLASNTRVGISLAL
jgi:selenocysteine lyase/cysteine desulfurase